MKKTIAIVGATEATGKTIIEKIAYTHYRLLLISNTLREPGHLRDELSAAHPGIEIDILDCLKDGCWEADIIILAVPPENLREVAERIKEVATQKIVIEIFSAKDNLQELSKILPYSRLVSISGDLQSEINISVDDKSVAAEISKIFNLADFHARGFFQQKDKQLKSIIKSIIKY